MPGRTTRGFRPGPIPAGPLGRRARRRRGRRPRAGRRRRQVAWRVEIEYSDDPAFADRPYQQARYATKPKRKKAGWYAGDLHVHAEHSALGDATMRETFDYAFRHGAGSTSSR